MAGPPKRLVAVDLAALDHAMGGQSIGIPGMGLLWAGACYAFTGSVVCGPGVGRERRRRTAQPQQNAPRKDE